MSKNKIKDFTLKQYNNLLHSGIFWELYPEATGIYREDILKSAKGEFKIEQDGRE